MFTEGIDGDERRKEGQNIFNPKQTLYIDSSHEVLGETVRVSGSLSSRILPTALTLF